MTNSRYCGVFADRTKYNTTIIYYRLRSYCTVQFRFVIAIILSRCDGQLWRTVRDFEELKIFGRGRLNVLNDVISPDLIPRKTAVRENENYLKTPRTFRSHKSIYIHCVVVSSRLGMHFVKRRKRNRRKRFVFPIVKRA